MPHLFPILLSSSSSLQQNYTHIFYQIKDRFENIPSRFFLFIFLPTAKLYDDAAAPALKVVVRRPTLHGQIICFPSCAFSAFIYLLLFLHFPFLSFAVVGVIWRNITKNKQNSGCKEFLLLSSYNIHIQFFLSPIFFF